jgi:hypothetical protein
VPVAAGTSGDQQFVYIWALDWGPLLQPHLLQKLLADSLACTQRITHMITMIETHVT